MADTQSSIAECITLFALVRPIGSTSFIQYTLGEYAPPKEA